MKLKTLTLFGILSFLLPNSNAATALLAAWDFQGSTTGLVGTVAAASATGAPSPLVYAANDGLQSVGAVIATIYLDGTQGSSLFTSGIANPEVTAFGGSNLNTAGTNLATTTAGAASLALANQSANTKSAIFKFSMTGYEDLSLTYVSQRTTTGFTGNQWSYSTDGTTFTNVGAAVVPASAFALITIDLSAETAIEGAGTVYLKYTLAGASASAGNNRLDNVQLNATVTVPEAEGALLLLGSLGLLGIQRRRPTV